MTGAQIPATTAIFPKPPRKAFLLDTGAVVAARDVRLLADRLDAALNNMSHGLCMVDADGNIAIANPQGDVAYGDSIKLTDSLREISGRDDAMSVPRQAVAPALAVGGRE